MKSLEALKTLNRAFGHYRKHVIALALFGMVSAFLESVGINAAIPLISFYMGGAESSLDFVTGMIRDTFLFFGIPFTFRYLLGFILGLFALRAVSIIIFGYIRGWIIADFLAKETDDVLRRTLLASWAYTLRQKIGSVHNTLVRDVQQTGSLLGAVAQVIQSITGFCMYLLIAVNVSATMTLYALGGGIVLVFFLRPFLRMARRIGTEAAGVEKNFAQFLAEHIIGMKAVKAAGAERAALTDGSRHIKQLRELSIRRILVHTLSTSFFQPASIVLVAALFLLNYNTPGFNIVSFAAALYLIQKVFIYLESGQNALQTVNELLPYARHIAFTKADIDAHREPSQGEAPFVFSKEIAFRRVSFSYNHERRVLDQVDLVIPQGKTVGLVGPSGAGKTSVADLLLRLFKPAEGEILVDGVSSETISLQAWRTQIGYVPQDPTLLNTTIEENIRFYHPSLTHEDIERAARQANIYDFIQELPDAFKTLTGDRGVMLSGGQRQRIMLARALARKPALLILDEATSALDYESERMIHESIRALRGTTAVLIIAHRPSTVAEADSIIVLRHGHLLESGPPKKLLADHSSYFYKMQQT